MADAPLVSIVVPLYNHERFIAETLESLIKQSHPELELIVVDDGSPDGSVAAVEAMRPACEARFRKFTLVTQANNGVSATLNRGIGLATGEFVFLLASDDLAQPWAIETFLSRMQADGQIALVCGDLDLIDENGRPTTLTRNGQVFTSFIRYVTAHRDDIDLAQKFGSYDTLISGNYMTVGTLLRRKYVLDVGGYDESCSIEDLDLWLKLARNYRFAFVDQPSILYRQHPNNTVLNQSEQLMFDEMGLMMREFDECLARGLAKQWQERMKLLIRSARSTALANKQALEAELAETRGRRERQPSRVRALLGAIKSKTSRSPRRSDL